MRWLTGKHFIQHTRERIHVGAAADFFFGRRLLGTHVVRRAETEACLGHAPASRRAHRQRDTKVHHHRAPVVQQEVLGLDIAMNHAVPMRVVECVGHFACDAHRFIHAELRFAIEFLANRFALDVGHHIKQKSIRCS